VGDGEVTETQVENRARTFTPPPRAAVREEAKQMFTGVTVKNLPQGMEMTALMTMLEERGLPVSMEDIDVKLYKERRKIAADIEGLTAEVCNKLIDSIHFKEFPDWERTVYCRGISMISPVKRAPRTLSLQEQEQE
jgi:hypothetical protein